MQPGFACFSEEVLEMYLVHNTLFLSPAEGKFSVKKTIRKITHNPKRLST